jgi:hypothetical protein
MTDFKAVLANKMHNDYKYSKSTENLKGICFVLNRRSHNGRLIYFYFKNYRIVLNFESFNKIS